MPFHLPTHFPNRPAMAAIATALVLATAPALADSTSSASSAASTSVGSSSTSLDTSSNSSSGNKRVAQGPYTVLDMTAVAQQPDMLQLRLQGMATAHGTADDTAATEFTLTLPRVTAEREQLAVGHTVLAQHRPYGLAFATVDNEGQARPFFLVLDDSWHRELHNRPVGG